MGIINLDTTNMEQQGAARDTFSEDGWHQVLISDSKGAANKQNSGYLLTLEIKCLAGADKDKVIEDYINVFHNNPQAQEIGQRTLSSYTHATGKYMLNSDHAEELRNVPFWIRTETIEEDYTPQNGQTRKVKRTMIRDWDSQNGAKHTAGNAGANAGGGNPPPASGNPPPNQQNNQAPQAGWGPPPPGAGGQPGAGANSGGNPPWGNGGGQPNTGGSQPATNPPWGGGGPQNQQSGAGGNPPWGNQNG